MDKYVIDKMTQEHNGKVYAFPLGAMAENIQTNELYQFISKEEKSKISEIDTIKQSFQDGCDILVSTCTTYGATPESNSPSDISAAIIKIYNDRYKAGRIQGQQDVIGDPGAYGIDQIKALYLHEQSMQSFSDFCNNLELISSAAATVTEDSKNADVVYQIPVSADKLLYGIAFTLEYIAHNDTDHYASARFDYSLTTVEGESIVEAGKTNANNTDASGIADSIYIDLLQNPFDTKYEYLNLRLSANIEVHLGRLADETGGAHAAVNFYDIQARYK